MNYIGKCAGGLIGDIATTGIVGAFVVAGTSAAALTAGVPVAAAAILSGAFAGTTMLVTAVARNALNRLLDLCNVEKDSTSRIFLNMAMPFVGLAAGASVVAGLVISGTVLIASSAALPFIGLTVGITLLALCILFPISLPAAATALIGTESLINCED